MFLLIIADTFILAFLTLPFLYLFMLPYSCHVFPFSRNHASGHLPIYFTLVPMSPQVLLYPRATTEVSSRSHLAHYSFIYLVPSYLLFYRYEYTALFRRCYIPVRRLSYLLFYSAAACYF